MNGQLETCKANAHHLLQQAQSRGEMTAEVREKFAHLPDSLDELDEMLAAERAKAELNIDTDPQVLEQYKRRKTLIEEKYRKLERQQKELEEMQQRMSALKEAWEPRVLSLISGLSERFSEYFDRMKCAGEVQLSRDASDYDKWGVEIMVKFRDKEKLSALSAHRQSGGERAITIIMYLLSLQHYSNAPFCVVDEINQGMDPRNERLMHTQIVETVCKSKEKRSQYLLITPKLLPNLEYHERMKVMVVNNGEYLPEY